MGVEGGRPSSSAGGAVGKKTGYARAASRHHRKASLCFAFVVWRTTSAQIHGKRPPSRPFRYVCMLGVVSVQLTALVRRRRHSRADVDVNMSIPVLSVCGRVSTRPCSGRRAVAVLREASRPHLILYSRRLFTGLDERAPGVRQACSPRFDPLDAKRSSTRE